MEKSWWIKRGWDIFNKLKSPIYKKRNETVKEKYGVEHAIYLPYRHKNNGRKSKIHKKVEKLLEELNINYEPEKVKNFKKNNYNPRPDIIIEDKKIIIEVNGDYWHANPKFYKENDIICKWTGNEKAKEIWKQDKKRLEQLEKFGYKTIVLWENEINKNLNKNKLWNMLN